MGPSDCSCNKIEKGSGILFQQLLAQAVIAGLENFADVLGHAVAHAGQLFQLLVVLGEIFDALVNAIEQLGDFFVAAVAPDHRAVNFE